MSSTYKVELDKDSTLEIKFNQTDSEYEMKVVDDELYIQEDGKNLVLIKVTKKEKMRELIDTACNNEKVQIIEKGKDENSEYVSCYYLEKWFYLILLEDDFSPAGIWISSDIDYKTLEKIRNRLSFEFIYNQEVAS